MPGCAVGPLREEIARQVGYACEVVLPATHDTASAVLAVPAQGEDFLYLSSGTWSLMGAELPAAVTTPDSMAANLTNEGGWGGTFRYLKNIMGLWMLQSVRRELPRRYTFDELCAMAEQAEIASLVDCNDARFLAPESMTAALQAACREQGDAVPETAGELAAWPAAMHRPWRRSSGSPAGGLGGCTSWGAAPTTITSTGSRPRPSASRCSPGPRKRPPRVICWRRCCRTAVSPTSPRRGRASRALSRCAKLPEGTRLRLCLF